MEKNFIKKSITISIILLFVGASVTITPNIFINTVKADSGQIILKDDFTKDNSLNTALWVIGGSVIQNFASAGGENLVSPQLSFGAAGMTMSGVNDFYQMTGVQSILSFSPPFNLTATVEGIVAHGNPFAIYLVSSDLQNQLDVIANTNSSNGNYYGVWAGNSIYFSQDSLLYSTPQNNVWYTFNITIDASGKGSVLMSEGNNVLGNVTNINAGMGPFFLILGQWEGAPYAPGSNEAIWQSVTLTSGGGNQPPNAPIITGPASGKAGQPHTYTFNTTDPNGDNVYYFIDWGDNSSSGWLGPYPSEHEIIQSHTWSKGTYTIKAKAMDSYGAESDWASLSITMPYSYNIPFLPFWERLFERFPHTFPILRQLLGY